MNFHLRIDLFNYFLSRPESIEMYHTKNTHTPRQAGDELDNDQDENTSKEECTQTNRLNNSLGTRLHAESSREQGERMTITDGTEEDVILLGGYSRTLA